MSVGLAEPGRQPEFEVYRDRAGEYRWRLASAGGAVVADSNEGFKFKAKCLASIEAFRKAVGASPPLRDRAPQAAATSAAAGEVAALAIAVEVFVQKWIEIRDELPLSPDDRRVGDALVEMAMEVAKTVEPPKRLLREAFRWLGGKADEFASSAAKAAGAATGVGVTAAAAGRLPHLVAAAQRVLALLG